jgi:hypothetical protein
MRIPALIALFSAVACGAPRLRSGGADPTALVECWRDAIGGRERLAALRTVEREARTEADQLTGTLHTWSRADGAYREDETLGPSSSVTVYAGGRAWSRAGLGAPLEMTHRDVADQPGDVHPAAATRTAELALRTPI